VCPNVADQVIFHEHPAPADLGGGDASIGCALRNRDRVQLEQVGGL
jgi:hypothetical protein